MNDIISIIEPYRIDILLGFILISVIRTSYSIYKTKQRQIDELQKQIHDTDKQRAISGSNNTVIQAAAGASVITGISDEGLKQIRDGMSAIQKQKDAELRAKFNLGYILFTATERNVIVPLGSPMDDILKVDWKTGYNVSFSDKTVTLSLPNMVFQTPDSGVEIHFLNSSKIVVPRQLGLFVCPVVMVNYGLVFTVVSTSENSIIIAMGIQSPPQKRP